MRRSWIRIAGWLLLVAASPINAAAMDLDVTAVPLTNDRLFARGVWSIETYDGALSDASWLSGPTDAIVPEGGNPDAFLHTGPIASEAPWIATIAGVSTVFVGGYRFMGVAELGVDIQVLAASPSEEDDRPVCLELSNNNRSPEDPADDCIVVQEGKRLSPAEQGWRAYNFKVPAYMTRLPSGWTVRGACGESSPDAVWNRVMQSVSRARFVLGDPGGVYPSQDWQIGFDNPRIRIGGKGGSGPALTDDLVVIHD